MIEKTDSTLQSLGRADRIRAILNEALAPTHLEVRDDSHKHVGHSGWRAEGETHFHVAIDSDALRELPHVAAHRKINNLLLEEFKSGLHALSVQRIYKL